MRRRLLAEAEGYRSDPVWANDLEGEAREVARAQCRLGPARTGRVLRPGDATAPQSLSGES